MKRFLIIPLLFLLLLAGCSTADADNTGEEGGHVTLVDAGWDSIRLHNAIFGYIAETAYGYTWEQIPGSSTITYEAVKNGDIDVQMENWHDNVASYDEDVAAGLLEVLGVNFDDAIQGLYVPAFLVEGPDALAPNLKTVQDLAMYADLFADPDDPGMGRIYGAIPGWMADEILRKKYEHVGLDSTFNYFSPGSDAALAAVLSDAYDAGEAIVGYYWEPTWLMGKKDFVRLTDEEPYNADTYVEGIGDFAANEITITVRPGFSEEYPILAALLSKYQTSSALTSQALAYMQDTGADYEETAKWFIEENSDLVKSWLPEEDAQKVFDSLS